jgi:hypothetical protein
MKVLIRILIASLILVCNSVIAQTVDSSDVKLISAGGGSEKTTDGKYQLTFSIGELFTNTTKNFNQVLTQGYQQAKSMRIVSVEYLENLNWKVEMYPNPVSEFLNVSFDKIPNTIFEIQIYNVLGQNLSVPIENLGSESENKFSLDFRAISAGSYVVKVWNSQSKKYVATMTVLKSESSK